MEGCAVMERFGEIAMGHLKIDSKKKNDTSRYLAQRKNIPEARVLSKNKP